MTSLFRSLEKQILAFALCLPALAAVSQESISHAGAAEEAAVPKKIRIALIVSPKGSDMSRATAPLRAGIMAAYEEQKDRYEIKEYPFAGTDQLESVLGQAALDGAMAAIGPIAKDAVEKVADLTYLPLPVVGANRPGAGSTPELFLSVDLSAESESEQLVDIAVESTKGPEAAGKPFIIMTSQVFYEDHLARAIENELKAKGVKAERRTVSTEQIAYLRAELRSKNARGVIFALNPMAASLIRPYVPPELPVFGTSYSNPVHLADHAQAKSQAVDLAGMVTLEIPPSLHVKEIAKLALGKEFSTLTNEQRQLFALGLDTWRVATEWVNWTQKMDIPDGATGALSWDKSRSSRVMRKMVTSVVSPDMVGKVSEEDPSSADDFVEISNGTSEGGGAPASENELKQGSQTPPGNETKPGAEAKPSSEVESGNEAKPNNETKPGNESKAADEAKAGSKPKEIRQ